MHGPTIADPSDAFSAWLDELRARTTLSGVIGPSVKLIKAGREFKACCPFHNEKTPSFTDQRREGLLPLLRLRGAWRCHPFPHRPPRAAVHGCREGTGRQGGDDGPGNEFERKGSGRSAL